MFLTSPSWQPLEQHLVPLLTHLSYSRPKWYMHAVVLWILFALPFYNDYSSSIADLYHPDSLTRSNTTTGFDFWCTKRVCMLKEAPQLDRLRNEVNSWSALNQPKANKKTILLLRLSRLSAGTQLGIDQWINDHDPNVVTGCTSLTSRLFSGFSVEYLTYSLMKTLLTQCHKSIQVIRAMRQSYINLCSRKARFLVVAQNVILELCTNFT